MRETTRALGHRYAGLQTRENEATEEPTLEQALEAFRAERAPRDFPHEAGSSPALRFESAMRTLRRAITAHPISARLQEALSELHDAERTDDERKRE
jgi:hypothetical protein